MDDPNWFIAAVLNEPFTVIGFLGLTAAWIAKAHNDRKLRQDDEQQRAESRSVEIADLIQEAQLTLDEADNKMRIARDRRQKTQDALSSKVRDDELDEFHVKFQDLVDENRKDAGLVVDAIGEFDRRDPSHENLLKAKKMVGLTKRISFKIDNVLEIFDEGEADDS